MEKNDIVILFIVKFCITYLRAINARQKVIFVELEIKFKF
jgi:hypothetical protein